MTTLLKGTVTISESGVETHRYEMRGENHDLQREFPGNRTDAQFADKTVLPDANAAAPNDRFSCSYTGKHDLGAFPPQRRNPKHEPTLSFLEAARADAEKYFARANSTTATTTSHEEKDGR